MARLTKSDLIARFDRRGNAPESWRGRAKELLAASSVLLRIWYSAIQHDPPKPIAALDYRDPALMLRAMAFECLLKARALERHMVPAKNGRYVKIPGVRNHDLVGLAKVVGFEMSRHEEKVLRRLSRWTTAGRYPIQLEWSDQVRLTAEGLMEFLTVGFHPDWDAVCESLVGRLAI